MRRSFLSLPPYRHDKQPQGFQPSLYHALLWVSRRIECWPANKERGWIPHLLFPHSRYAILSLPHLECALATNNNDNKLLAPRPQASPSGQTVRHPRPQITTLHPFPLTSSLNMRFLQTVITVPSGPASQRAIYATATTFSFLLIRLNRQLSTQTQHVCRLGNTAPSCAVGLYNMPSSTCQENASIKNNRSI